MRSSRVDAYPHTQGLSNLLGDALDLLNYTAREEQGPCRVILTILMSPHHGNQAIPNRVNLPDLANVGRRPVNLSVNSVEQEDQLLGPDFARKRSETNNVHLDEAEVFKLVRLPPPPLLWRQHQQLLCNKRWYERVNEVKILLELYAETFVRHQDQTPSSEKVQERVTRSDYDDNRTNGMVEDEEKGFEPWWHFNMGKVRVDADYREEEHSTQRDEDAGARLRNHLVKRPSAADCRSRSLICVEPHRSNWCQHRPHQGVA